MIPAQFDYAAPTSLEEALGLLEANQDAKILAGGHSLLRDIKLRRLSPAMLVDLRRVQDLRGISHDNGGIQIGAMTTLASIVGDKSVQDDYPALVEAIRDNGDPQDLNVGTIGGGLANVGAPSGLPAVALVAEATIKARGPRGPRAISADEFIVGPSETALEDDEIITSVDFPSAGAGTGNAYEELNNPADDSAICGVVAKVALAKDGTVTSCRVAVTGATDHAMRLRESEAALEGKEPTGQQIAGAAEQAGQGLTFVSDLYASADYRGYLTKVFAERALARAVERAAMG